MVLFLSMLTGWAQDDAGSGSGSGNPAEGREQIEVRAHEQITVYDVRVAERRQAIVQELRQLGYTQVKREDGRAVFRSDVSWHPDVLLYDDGFMLLRRPPPRFAPPDAPGLAGSPLACVLLLPCTRVGGLFVSGRKLEPQKSEVALQTHDVIESWRTAVVDDAMRERLSVGIPTLLDAIWLGGTGPDGESLPTPADRRAALLDFWATRSDTPEGDEARAIAATYIEQMVQTSDTPLLPDELAAAETRCGCRLDLNAGTATVP
jgi:hypothetical protein